MPPTLPNSLTNGTTADASQVMADLNAINAAVDQATVTSLPGSPYDGQEVYYVADATNGIVWHLKYRAASGSAYKWECVGGGYLSYEDSTSRTTTSNAGASIGGSSLTNPLAGDYEVDFGGAYYLSAINFIVELTQNNGTTGSDAARDGVDVASSEKGLARRSKLIGLAASTTIRTYGKIVAGSGQTLTVTRNYCYSRPIRVG